MHTRIFTELAKEDVAIAGGKGASLGEMTRAGIPVPPGFVVLAPSFDRFLEETDLDVEIDAALRAVNHREMHTVENASEKIQALILGADMPTDIGGEIQKAFTALGARFVAVRSSATSEDSAAAAWAGQLDSYLNTTEDHLLENVKRCWASLFTPRAIFYRFEKGLHTEKVSVAVVVQKMVESESAGIAFSVHPVSQDRNQMIIEAGFGLGEAVVSGQITPDSYVLRKEPREIIDKNVVVQVRALARASGGGNEWTDLPPEKGNLQVLNDSEIVELAGIVVGIERHYGFPCDVEWAREKGKFYIVQSRPITTLQKDIHGVSTPSEAAGTSERQSSREGDLVQRYDLGQATWTHKGLHGVLHTFFPLGRTCWDMQAFFGDGARFTIFFVKNDYVYWYWKDDELTRIREIFFERLREDGTYLDRLKAEWEERIAVFEAVLKELDQLDLTALSEEELTTWYGRFFESYVGEYRYFMVLGDAVSMHADRYFVPIFEKILGQDFAAVFPQLVTSDHLSFVEEENSARYQLISMFRRTGSVPKALLEAHAAKYFYLQNNYAKGLRLTAEDFEKMIREDAEKNIPAPVDMRNEHEEKKRMLMKQYKISGWNEKLLSVMNEFFGIQDTRKKYVLVSTPYQFRFLEEAARRTGTPVALLKYSVYPEYGNVLRGEIDPQVLEERKKICACVHVEGRYEIFDGAIAERAFAHFQNTGKKESELRGIVASPGKARGRAKIVLKFHDAVNVEEGDVLVSSMTRPEMVPAMKLAAAIVTDEGGVTSHAAIISRELKIPCVIGVKIATQVLKDGDLVEVDADNGIVQILKRESG